MAPAGLSTCFTFFTAWGLTGTDSHFFPYAVTAATGGRFVATAQGPPLLRSISSRPSGQPWWARWGPTQPAGARPWPGGPCACVGGTGAGVRWARWWRWRSWRPWSRHHGAAPDDLGCTGRCRVDTAPGAGAVQVRGAALQRVHAAKDGMLVHQGQTAGSHRHSANTPSHTPTRANPHEHTCATPPLSPLSPSPALRRAALCCAAVLFRRHKFIHNSVDGALLLRLTDAQLKKELGILPLGHREGLLEAVRELAAGMAELDQVGRCPRRGWWWGGGGACRTCAHVCRCSCCCLGGQ